MNFRCAVAFTLLLSFGLPSFANDLAGKVVDEAGKPVVNATVIVLSAQPRTGRPAACPACYEDCGRTSKTGPDGQFVMLEFDRNLSFRVAAIADGRRAQIADNVVPQNGPTNFTLEALPAGQPPECRVRGRVVDSAGRPIAGAVVEPFGRRQGNRSNYGPLTRYGVDPFAVTNAQGEFLITGREPTDAYFLAVKAPRFAPKRFPLIPVGDDIEKNKLVVDEGGSVRGRLVRGGQPAEGVIVGICHIDRTTDNFVGHYETTAGADGRFELQFMPKVDYYIYSLMGGRKGQGTLPLDFLPLASADSPRDLGDVELGPAHPVAGRVVLTDRENFPGEIPMRLVREGAWDPQEKTVSSDGTFRFEDVPHDESITLEFRITGYRLSQRNRFQHVRETAIALHVDRPREGIEIIFEPDPPAPRRGR